jgi:hypothetical protein
MSWKEQVKVYCRDHQYMTIKQYDADGVERPAGIMCLDCERTYWADGTVTA